MAETILITGTSTGIGYGTAKAFTKSGYWVINSVTQTLLPFLGANNDSHMNADRIINISAIR